MPKVARGRGATGSGRHILQPPFTPAIIELVDQSVATAGDYRRFFEIDGKHYSAHHRSAHRLAGDARYGLSVGDSVGLHAGGRAWRRY